MSHDEQSQPDCLADRTAAGLPEPTTFIALYLRESLVDANDREGLRDLLGASSAAFLVDARRLLVEEGHAVDSMTDADLLTTVEAMLVSGELFLLRDDPILTVPELPRCRDHGRS